MTLSKIRDAGFRIGKKVHRHRKVHDSLKLVILSLFLIGSIIGLSVGSCWASDIKRDLVEAFLKSTSLVKPNDGSSPVGKIVRWETEIRAHIISDDDEDAKRFREIAGRVFDLSGVDWTFEKKQVNTVVLLTKDDPSTIEKDYGDLIQKFFVYESGFDDEGYKKFIRYSGRCIGHVVVSRQYDITASVVVINSGMEKYQKEKCFLVHAFRMIGFVGMDGNEDLSAIDDTGNDFKPSFVGEYFIAALYHSGIEAGDTEIRVRPILERLLKPLKLEVEERGR